MSENTKPLVIRELLISPPTVMAPMAGVTDAPFRQMVRQRNCGLVCSEMISANGLYQNSVKTVQMMAHNPAEKPISIQIFGARPELMAAAADRVAQSGADILDINFGCSVKKVVKTGAGAALMKEMGKAKAVISAVRKAVAIPLTIKVRSGWDPSGDDALALCQMAEDLGVDAVCVHPRTARQGFSGHADWSVIQRIKQKLSIAVIGNGDIRQAADALAMIRQTSCDGVMIGRAAIGNPWIFDQVLALLEGRSQPQVDVKMRFSAIRDYAKAMCACYGETHACRLMRSRLGWLARGLPRASAFRQAATQIGAIEDVEDLLSGYEHLVSEDLRATDASTKPTIKSE